MWMLLMYSSCYIYIVLLVLILMIIILLQSRATRCIVVVFMAIHVQLHVGTFMRCSVSKAFLITESLARLFSWYHF